MKKISRITFLLLISVFLSACTSNDANQKHEVIEKEEVETESPSTEDLIEEKEAEEAEVDKEVDKEEIEEETSISMNEFFPAADVMMHFEGEGNEFAELNVEVIHLGEDYVIKREDNGGSYFETIFKISADKIDMIQDNIIDLDEPLPTIEALEGLESIGIYLSKPIEVGETFENWEVIDISATLDTPFENFSEVIIIESKEEDFINRKYFVRNYGEVKRESIMTTEDFDFIITSTLDSIEDL